MVHYVLNERLDVFQQRMNIVSLADPSFWTRFVRFSYPLSLCC
jgi:acyl-CoA oxidase